MDEISFLKVQRKQTFPVFETLFPEREKI